MDSIDVAFAGAAEQARLLAAGEITAPELIELYLERIARLDPELRSYRTVMADHAREAAIAAQERLDAGESAPLLGVPIAIKDDTDVAGELTCFGSNAHGPAATADAEVVTRLREAGAIILGKTAVPEMMVWPFTESVSFGATHNPWDVSCTPGGSSGGSAAAVAAGLAPFALGTDGGGSIRIPATWCGLYGIKPQRGRIPTAPMTDGWCGLAHLGPLTRTVEDAALFLDVTSDPAMPGPDGGFLHAVAQPPKRLRIALSTQVPPLVTAHRNHEQRAAVAQAGDLLRELGHDVTEREIDYPTFAVYGHFLPRMYRGVYDAVQELPHPERLDSRTRGVARIGQLISDRLIAKVRAAESEIAARINTIFDDVDVVITPGCAAGPSKVGAYRRLGGVTTMSLVAARVPYQAVFNATGQPAAVLPWGLDRAGLPLSIQLVGRPFDEATLLALSAEIEADRPWAQRRPSIS
ncbi:putative amidase AmiB2 [Mycolicibacterium insubricum]|uniref:amidase n=1 Tax=Mycolicibacterium insubricum TaxID=444597 RepID=A0A1X0DME2_9MYCO|nr:amidase [Mycolicibacterium insubricum]MCB9442166.1 amidase [Mycolicibacterium sp.]MCV7082344.1 amidase [Mycolicibacterium insubricum]ORA73563.1 amidase [Mycolicibacterium insubricum]BBZ68275.1 putative amidase AmiB2 [Mycolicibacterium insubricum]